MRSRATTVIAMFIASGLLGVAVQSINTPKSQSQPAPTDPRLFDLALAQSELNEIRAQQRVLETEIGTALDLIQNMSIERDILDLTDNDRSQRLQKTRTDARRIAINAYVGANPPLSGIVLLDSETISDLAWSNALGRHQADQLATKAQTYAVLAGEADANVLALSDEINDETRRLEAVQRNLTKVTQQLKIARSRVQVAEIHAQADQVFSRTRRSDPTAEQWRKLRHCESTETYSVDTGNGFYGAYQFDWTTWETVGGDGNPAHDPPAEQDARARLLYANRGSQPWPICGQYLP